MKGQTGFLFQVIKLLEDAGIPYMITGSVGSSAHGEPRATNDIDIVIDPAEPQLETFVQSAAGRFYASLESAKDAFRDRSLFNVISVESGYKADLIIRKDRPFSRAEFERKSPVDLSGGEVLMASPEDIILSKLEWSAKTESERHIEDALKVAAMQADALDRAYLEKWAPDLGVSDLLGLLLASLPD